MGALTALPALDVKTPQQPNVLDQFSQLQALRGNQQAMEQRAALAPLQQQEAQQSVQAGGLDIQQKQQQLKNSQALTAAYQKWDGKNLDDLSHLALENGASGEAVQSIQQHALDVKSKYSQMAANDATTGAKNLETQQKKNDGISGALSALSSVPDDQLPQAISDTAARLVQEGLLDPQHGQTAAQLAQLPPAQARQKLEIMRKGVMSNSQLLDEAKGEAKAKLDNANANNAAGKIDPKSPLYAPSADAVALGTAPGAEAIQSNQVQMAGRKAGAEESARLPGEMRLAAQRQALSQGSPEAAGQLLVNGDATLSELKARGATPDFIARTLFAARKQSGGQYNAQEAEANFNVAKSQANTAFFGSAKSLTDPGGTLDQLAAAAKDIPGGQIPVFNTIADAVKAAAGSGPIAKYASIMLGVSDDYSKVMGGGAGSDSSRTQALHLVPANASPEARAAAIQGIRGAVGSQINSRIGKNPIMKRMYGSPDASAQTASAAPAGLKDTGQTSKRADGVYDKDGKHYTVVSGKVYE